MTEAIDKIQVVDDDTVKFEMKHPDPNLLYNLFELHVGRRAEGLEGGARRQVRRDRAIGTGPYKLESFTVGQQTVLVRNDDYSWGPSLSKNPGRPRSEADLPRDREESTPSSS